MAADRPAGSESPVIKEVRAAGKSRSYFLVNKYTPFPEKSLFASFPFLPSLLSLMRNRTAIFRLLPVCSGVTKK